MAKYNDRPRSDDAVLGGLEGVKRRLASNVMRHKVVALSDALNYGQAGLNLVIQVLKNESEPLQWIAYLLLKERSEIEFKQALYQHYWTDYLYVFFHEMLTPVKCILPSIEIIVRGWANDQEEVIEFLQNAYQAMLYMSKQADELADRIKNLKLVNFIDYPLCLTPINLVETIEHLRQYTNYIYNVSKNRQLVCRLSVPATINKIIIYGHTDLLTKVFINLIANAKEFAEIGDIEISVEIINEKVIFQNIEFTTGLKVEIAYTVIPMSREKISSYRHTNVYIFSGGDYDSSGLGLIISRHLIERMGGKISLDSPGEGLGSTVTFTVPCFTVMD